MIKDELFIEKTCGKTRPFTVPDNYFAGLHDKIMDVVNADNTVVMKANSGRRRRLIAAIAASVAVLLVCVGIALSEVFVQNGDGYIATSVKNDAVGSNSSFEQMADYMMLDNDDVYSYLAYE